MIINVLIAILLLSIIIVAHEFGHFIVAKANGVCVVEFSIGFGPRLFGFRKGDTDYCIKALPFGGSCRMLGAEDYLEDGAGDEEDEDGYAISAVEKRSREMLKKYGNDAKLFNCIYDNLYFYVPYNDCKSMPYYLRKCVNPQNITSDA